MDAQNDVRVRMAPMVALAGAVVFATATVVSAPPVQQAAHSVVPTVAHQVKSLPVQLTAYNPFVPYAQPVGVIGYALTAVFATQTATLLPAFDGATQALTAAGWDRRWAQQPVVIARSLALPIAVAVQTALVGGLEGTYLYGKFTPAEALSFFVDALKDVIDGFIAAEKALFNPPALPARVSGAVTSAPEASSTELPDAESVVTVPTAQADSSAATANKDEHAAVGAQEVNGETTALETTGAETAAPKKPTFKLPAFKLPKFTLPTLKFPAPKKSPRPATAGSDTSAANADSTDDSAVSSRKSASATSNRGGSSDSTAD